MSAVRLQERSAGAVRPLRRALVVVGMHRSGTSAMTRVLSLLGAALPKELMRPSESNPSGHWEPQNVANLNDEILRELDSDWDDVFAFRPHEYLSNFDHFYLSRAVELLDREFNGAELIALKDPRISILTTFWNRALVEAGYTPHYIIMVRTPMEVAESLRARNGFPREKSLLLWSSYMLAVERDTRAESRSFISYDELIRDWRSIRRRVEAGTGMPFPRDTAAAANEIDRFLDRRLQHHHFTSQDLFSRTDVPEQVKTLYRIFLEACQGTNVDTAALEAIRAEMERMELLVGPLLADMRASTRRFASELAEMTDAHSNACGRANSLEQQLSAERTLREAEAEKASQSEVEYQTRLSELAERLATIEFERTRLSAEVQEKNGAVTELAARVSALETLLVERETELTAIREQAATAEAAAAANEEKLAERAQELAALAKLLDAAERKLELAKTEAEQERKNAKDAATASESKLAERAQELAALTKLLDAAERKLELAKTEAEQERLSADAAKRASEDKLRERFEELATVTKLLKQQEHHSAHLDEQMNWLLAVSGLLRRQPRWWGWLPRSFGRRRVLRKLRDAGLFDGDAYLRRHPDVAAARADPLDHYLNHGLNEGRAR